MNIFQKSFIWALISFPISWFALKSSFALAHGSLLVLLPFVVPGFLVTFALVGEGESESVFKIVFYIGQYFSYALIIYLGSTIKRYFSKQNANT